MFWNREEQQTLTSCSPGTNQYLVFLHYRIHQLIRWHFKSNLQTFYCSKCMCDTEAAGGPSLWSLTAILYPSITVSAKSTSAVLVTTLHSLLCLTGSIPAVCLSWTVLCRGGWRKCQISRCSTWSAICVCVLSYVSLCVCVCVCVCVTVPNPVASLERGVLSGGTVPRTLREQLAVPRSLWSA